MLSLANRRTFLKQSSILSIGAAVGRTTNAATLHASENSANTDELFQISLAEWSLNKAIFGGKIDNLDFAKTAKVEFGIEAIEYVNQFFKNKAKDQKYLTELKARAADHGVKNLLIMIDGEGALGAADTAQRKQAVENHYKWVEAAKSLGCHAIRVNAQSAGSYPEQLKLAADGLRRLSEFAQTANMNILVENHGGLSSNGKWLAGVIKTVALPNCGTLPDFGNFAEYDRYQGVQETMPFAKAVSAKSHHFDKQGNETKTDYFKMLKIVVDAGYHGYVGIEYEGGGDEFAGIRATQQLLTRVRNTLL